MFASSDRVAAAVCFVDLIDCVAFLYQFRDVLFSDRCIALLGHRVLHVLCPLLCSSAVLCFFLASLSCVALPCCCLSLCNALLQCFAALRSVIKFCCSLLS